MAKAAAVWSARDAAHVAHFRRHVLAPLIVATRPLDLRTAEAVDDAARAWILSLAEIPADVLEAGVARLLQDCPAWMPRPESLRVACAQVVAERRKAIAPQAEALVAECIQCDGSGFEPVVVEGVAYVKRCGCKARALALLDGLPAPIALPPVPEDELARSPE